MFSFNYGDKNYDQLKRIYKICMYFITVSSIVILVMALVFAEPIVGIFSGRDSRTYLKLQQMDFSCFLFNYIFAGIKDIFASAMFLLHLVMEKIGDHLVLQDVYFHRGEYPCTAIG